jgi:hypothetical protein
MHISTAAISSLTDVQTEVHVYKNKTIVVSAKVMATLGCSFEFQWYPLDTQSCDLKIESCE